MPRLPETPALRQGLQVLMRAMQRACRTSDTLGLYQKNGRVGVGVILHHTVPEKASRVVESITSDYESTRNRNGNRVFPALHTEVWSYPRHNLRHTIAAGGNGHATAALPFTEARRRSPLPIWKRGMDILGSLVGLGLFSPILAGTALLIKVVSPGPVFFTQDRVGYLGRTFRVVKFRTMVPNNDTSSHKEYLAELIRKDASPAGKGPAMEKKEGHPSIIRFGGFLRQSCIDELPQLFNVLRGEMSLVGPRPAIPYEVDEYLRWHTERFQTVPGMTGLWQVSGKNNLSFKEMVRLDIRYSRDRSFWLDVRILFRTPKVILTQLSQHLERRRKGRKS